VSALVLWLSWLACVSTPVPADLSVHHLAFGGDLCAGKELNEVIHDPKRSKVIFSDAPAILHEADVTVVNLEGVLSGGGRIADKGEARPILYRARPEFAAQLASSGVDVMTLANNHSGDYGPDALRETIDALAVVGIDAVGAGIDLDAAQTPAYRRVGDTVVAFVGADLTNTHMFRATEARPGSLAVAPADAVATLGPIVARARRHADLVVLTVHWGENFAKEPSAETRAVGKALIRAGFDAILGHSAHVLQGVELVDGKPIVYDAGNFLAGHTGLEDQAVAIVYDLAFTRAGVVSVTPHAIQLEAGRVAPGPASAVQDWAERSEKLGTSVVDGRVRCDPGSLLAATEEGEPPRRPVPSPPFVAPSDAWVDALPDFATPIEARFDNGMTLIGYHMVADTLRIPKTAQVLDLYFRVDAPQTADLRIEARGHAARLEHDVHAPADWSLAGDELQVGKILHDRVLLRIRHASSGDVDFSVALLEDGELVGVQAPREMHGGVWLGTRSFHPDAERVFQLPAMDR
jgi:poly-gamma-glutamate capsule biosynthesis protein CapA/YwtB (metallophosphatase superfamily)